MTQEEKVQEIWKPIVGYEEYEVSNKGRIKRLAYYKTVCKGSKQFCEERILAPQMRKFGYQAVTLSHNSKVKSFLIHRLVATAFIPNPKNLPQVNHKDENPSNNNANNLEWCTQEYNSNYGTSKFRIAEKLKNGIMSKPVEQYNKQGEFIREYPSAIEASRVLGLSVSGIVSCCNNKKKYAHCGGFFWKYKNSDKEIIKASTIAQMDKSGKTIGVYYTVTEASKATGISRTSIHNCLTGLSNTSGGYIWKKEI